MGSVLNHRQKRILKKVVEIEGATDYHNRCLNVLVCPRCGCKLVQKYMPFFDGQFLKCDNDKCNFEVSL